LRVFDPGTFEPTASSDDEPFAPDWKRPDALTCEIGGHALHARRTDSWDAIVALLVALSVDDPEYFHAVMRGCRRLSNSTPELDGLDDLLLAPDQLIHDVALDRERRRSKLGYSTPADARAFLEMARREQ